MKRIDIYLSFYDYIENLSPEDPVELSAMIEELMYLMQDVLHDYAEDHGWDQPEPFM